MAICIVFVPILFMSGAAGSLFKPMAMAVIFAMIASYLISRTVVPVVVNMLLKPEVALHQHAHADGDHGATSHAVEPPAGDIFWRLHQKFNRYFDMLLEWYRHRLNAAMHHKKLVIGVYILLFVGTAAMLPVIGRDFFPSVDSGSFRLHVRAPAGTRIEKTEELFARVEQEVKRHVPNGQLDLILDNIGLPVGGVNFAYSTTGSIGPSDGEIMVTLHEEHMPTPELIETLRTELPRKFPQLTFFFQPADITTQILNFGLPAPVDIQVVGSSKQNFDVAKALAKQVATVPGTADVHIHQVLDVPELHVQVDRERAIELGLTQRDVANSLLVNLSGSGQAFPNFWLDPRNGVSYLIAVQTPQYRIRTLNDLGSISFQGIGTHTTQQLSGLASVERTTSAEVINHYNVQPVYDIYANVADRDLGGVSTDINHIIDKMHSKLPKGTSLVVRGQVESMNTSFASLGAGLVFSIIFIYLLLVVNYQSLVDPLIIVTALPGALCGIVWILFLTHTVFSVPALMGAIMCIGVSTANAILVVTFANQRRLEGDSALTAAITSGCTRLRPVLMTAAAMIIGMLPMALGMGEGGEQNAPLGRAVIGGLILATISTLLFVPVAYSILRKAAPQADHHDEDEDEAMFSADPSQTITATGHSA
jgi:multidrug efflux pump subunit AcrB